MIQAETYQSPRRALKRLEPSIPAHYYYDAQHYERELESIWYNMWIQVARLEEIPNPGDYKVATIGTQQIVLLKDQKGTLRAFHNTCRHRGSILCIDEKGSFKGDSIVCPYHGWTYSFKGGLIATPLRMESTGFKMSDYWLYNVAVGTWGGYIFVNLAGERAVPLELALGDIPSRFVNYHAENLRVGKRIVLDIKANWKLIFENFFECFHCPGVHPEMCTILGPKYWTGGAWGIREDEKGNLIPELGPEYADRAKTMTMDGTSKIPSFRHLTDEEKNKPYNSLVLQPSLIMFVSPDHLHTYTMLPTGPDSVRMTYEWLFEPESMARPDFDLDYYLELWVIINEQDALVCERQQMGLRCREFKHGNFVPQEMDCHNFNQWVLQALGELKEEVVETTAGIV